MADEQKKSQKKTAGMYFRYAGMIVTSAVLMYLFTYLNTLAWDHLYFSEERVYLTLTMTAMMAVVMLSFMLPMLTKRWLNFGIYAGSVILFLTALWLIRSQAMVQDVNYMKSMIPHHSIAILTSERAQISDPRVRELANEIIESQRREIAEMKELIDDIRSQGKKAAKNRRRKHPPKASAIERKSTPVSNGTRPIRCAALSSRPADEDIFNTGN